MTMSLSSTRKFLRVPLGLFKNFGLRRALKKSLNYMFEARHISTTVGTYPGMHSDSMHYLLINIHHAPILLMIYGHNS